MINIKLKLSTSLMIFVVFLILCTILPNETQQFGLKKNNIGDLIKTKKHYPFHKITKIIHVSDDGDEIEEEYFFEKVNKADIPIVTQVNTHSLLSDAGQDDVVAEDIEVEESKNRIASGFFGFFTGSSSSTSKSPSSSSKDDDDNDNTKNQPVIDQPNETNNDNNNNNNNNGIINWLKAFTRTDQQQPNLVTKSAVHHGNDNHWIQYLDRWPINAIFPFNKIEKYAFPPKTDPNNMNPNNMNQKTMEPISDEHFTSLLGTLPSFVVNPNYISDIDCRQQLQILQRQLRGHKLWPMQMLDASAKIPSGILRGNINQFGDFEMCTNIKTIVKVTTDVSVRIKGKYCLAHIEIQYSNNELKIPVHLSHGRGLWNSHLGDPSHFAPRYSIVNWGICIPNSCPATIVRDTIDLSLRPYNHTGIHFHVEIDENDCFIRNRTNFKNLIKRDNKVGFTIGYYILFLSLVITATIIEKRKLLTKFCMKLFNLLTNFIKTLTSTTTTTSNNTKNENEDENPNTNNDSIFEKEPEPEPELDPEILTEIEQSNESTESPTPFLKEIILAFSPTRSIHELWNSNNQTDTNKFAIFHLLKIICTFMLYICMKYLMIGHMPVLNRDKLVKSLNTPISIFYRSPLIYLDILLMISGFLKSYHMCSEMEDKSHIYVIKRFTAKVLRYLPTLYAVLFFQTWILPYLGSGPLWSNLIGRQTKFCEESMWRNLFGVQNVINFEESCSPLTIQHSVELQLYLLIPLIVWLFYCNSDIGFMVYGGIHAMSVASRYSRTNLEQLSSTIFHGIQVLIVAFNAQSVAELNTFDNLYYLFEIFFEPKVFVLILNYYIYCSVSKFYRTANLLYSSPIPRATSYLIGIGAGILHKTSGDDWKDMSKIGLISGWITAISSIIWCFWYPMNGTNSDYIYNSIEAASYASWSPLLLGLGLGWIVFMLPVTNFTNHNQEIIITTTPLHNILTMKPILYLSRISYPMQLISYIVVLYYAADIKESNRYSISDLINFNEIAIIILFATILAIVIDIPMKKIQKILLDKLLPDRLTSNLMNENFRTNDTDEHVGEELEDEEYDEEEHDSQMSNNITEPNIDDVWGSQSDEIDYVSIKRNSLNAKQENLWIHETIDENILIDADTKDSTESDLLLAKLKEQLAEAGAESELEQEYGEGQDEEDEEEVEIAEEDEIIHRPETPEKPPSPIIPKTKSPPPSTNSYRRRRTFNE